MIVWTLVKSEVLHKSTLNSSRHFATCTCIMHSLNVDLIFSPQMGPSDRLFGMDKLVYRNPATTASIKVVGLPDETLTALEGKV